MTRSTRRAVLAGVGVLLVAALVAGVFVVRWQRSADHRADEIAASYREMPGVSSAYVREPDPGVRELFVRLPASAQRDQLRDVTTRISKLPEDVVSRVKVTIGAATVTNDPDDPGVDNIDLQWALRGVHRGTVDIDGYPAMVWVRADTSSAVLAGQEVATALDVRGFRDAKLSVSGERLSTITGDDVGIPAVRAVLDELAPVASSIHTATVTENDVRVVPAAGRSPQVTAAARRAAGKLTAFGTEDGKPARSEVVQH